MGQQTQMGESRGVELPLDDLSYDLVTILHQKSKALEAYDKYVRDAERAPEVSQLLERIRRQDTQAIEQLETCVVRALAGKADTSDEESRRVSAADTQTTGDGNGSDAV